MTAPLHRRPRAAAAALVLLAAPLGATEAGAAWWSPWKAPAPAASQVVEVQSTPEIAEQSLRISRLEEQMRQLNGRIDELTWHIQQLQEALRLSREDTEYRLQELEGGAPRPPADRSQAPSAPAPAAGGAVITTGPADAPVDLSSGFSLDPDGSMQMGAPPQVLGTVPAPGGGGGPLDLSAIARGEQAWGSGDDLLPSELPTGDLAVLGAGDPSALPPAGANGALAPPAASGGALLPPPPAGEMQVAAIAPETPEALYNQSYEHVVNGDYGLAEAGFRKFLQANMRSPRAGDAYFWLGESLFARERYRDAADAFLTAYRDYPGSEKAPESLLKLGQSLEGLGETDAACATYGELEKKYPSASAGVLDAVADRKSEAGC